MYQFRHALLAGTGSLCLLAVAACPLPNTVFAVTRPSPSLRLSVHEPSPKAHHHAYRVEHRHHRRHTVISVNYTVQPSNTLWQIAHVAGVTVSTLKQENRLHTNTIYVGEHLRVPPRWRSYVRRMQAASVSTNTGMLRRDMTVTSAVSDAPSFLVPIYKAAGDRYGIPWTVLAAIHKTETSFGVTDCPVSSDGAEGPMQFLPDTFAAYGVTAPGQGGRPHINNVDDAIYTAAHMLSMDGFAQNPDGAIYAYNHSQAYVQQIKELAGLR